MIHEYREFAGFQCALHDDGGISLWESNGLGAITLIPGSAAQLLEFLSQHLEQVKLRNALEAAKDELCRIAEIFVTEFFAQIPAEEAWRIVGSKLACIEAIANGSSAVAE